MFLKSSLILILCVLIFLLVSEEIEQTTSPEHRNLKNSQGIIFAIFLIGSYFIVQCYPGKSPMIVICFSVYTMFAFGNILSFNDEYKFDEQFIAAIT